MTANTFGAETTAAEVIAAGASPERGAREPVDLRGKRAIVTGGASGIGIETARALASAGAEVTLAVRDVAAAASLASELDARVGHLDLTDLASVASFVQSWSGPLDILVNNAGVMATPLTRTAKGWELQFATNHLGHFALSTGLHDALAAAASASDAALSTGGARVVSVSSVGHVGFGDPAAGGVSGAIDFDDIQFERRSYDKWAAYGQSKTANILFGVEAARLWADDGIVVNSLNPGRIPGTALMRHLDDVPAAVNDNTVGVSWKNHEQGAATSVLLAASPLVDGVTGRYFEDCQIAGPFVPGIRRGVADYAIDPANAERLWQVSLDLLNG